MDKQLKNEIRLHNYLNNFIKDHPSEAFIRDHWSIHGTIGSKREAILDGLSTHVRYLSTKLFENEQRERDLIRRNLELKDEIFYLTK